MGTVFKRGGKKNRDGYYYIMWEDWTSEGKKRRSLCTRTTDKSAAEQILRKKEAEAALRREGVVDPRLEALRDQRSRKLAEHLADFENDLRTSKPTEEHVRKTLRFIRAAATACGWSGIGDIAADGVNEFAASRLAGGASARTVQALLTAVKSFSKWLARNGKLFHDPLATVKKPNPESDRRLQRRMLLPDEWPRLREATEQGRVLGKMPGPERALLYRTAIETGLRASELTSLKMSDLHLDAVRPFVTCDADETKNGKKARQYLTPALAATLRQNKSAHPHRRTVFEVGNLTNLAKVLRKDLAAARAAWIAEVASEPMESRRREESDLLNACDGDGRKLDFHALRHTCGAWLAKAGIQPKVIQAVMRHSSITLTMDAYGHLFPGQEADAVASLATSLDQGASQPAPRQGKINRRAQHTAQQGGRGVERDVAASCDEVGEQPASPKRRKKRFEDDLRAKITLASKEIESRAGLIRTDDQGIMSPLL